MKCMLQANVPKHRFGTHGTGHKRTAGTDSIIENSKFAVVAEIRSEAVWPEPVADQVGHAIRCDCRAAETVNLIIGLRVAGNDQSLLYTDLNRLSVDLSGHFLTNPLSFPVFVFDFAAQARSFAIEHPPAASEVVVQESSSSSSSVSV